MADWRGQFLGYSDQDPYLTKGQPTDQSNLPGFNYPDPTIAAHPLANPNSYHVYDPVNIDHGYTSSGNPPFDANNYDLAAFAQSSDEEDDYAEDDDQSQLDARDLQVINYGNNEDIDPDYDSQDSEKEPSEDDAEAASDDGISDDEGVRGRGRGRGRPRGRGRGRGRGQRGTTVSRGRGGRGRPRGRGRGGLSRADEGDRRRRPRGPAAGPPPPAAYTQAQTKAFNASLANDFDTALVHGLEAVRVAPNLMAAHSLLSEIYEKRGERRLAIETLMHGALMTRNAGLFQMLALRITDNAELWPGDELVRKKLECYNNGSKLSPKDFDMRLERFQLELELGETMRAYKTCKTLLALRPGEYELLLQLHQLCSDPIVAEGKDGERRIKPAIACFDKSFEHFMGNETPDTSEFDWDLLLKYAELVQRVNTPPANALRKVKKYARWLVGREEETFWDDLADDCEWDEDDLPRRITVPSFIVGQNPADTYGIAIPLALRLRMGIFRLHMGRSSHEEAITHLKPMLVDTKGLAKIFKEHYEICLQAANAMAGQFLFTAALRCFERLQTIDFEGASDEEVLLGSLVCYRALRQADAMGRAVEQLLKHDIKNVKLGAMVARYLQDAGRNEESETLAKNLFMNKGADIALRAEGVALPKISRTARRLAKERRRYQGEGVTSVKKPITIPDELLQMMDIEPGQEISWDVEKYHKLGKFLQRFGPDQQHRIQEARGRDKMIRELGQHLEHLTERLDAGESGAAAEYMELGQIMVDEFANCKAFFPTKERRRGFTGYSVSRRANVDDVALELAELAGDLAIEEGKSIDMLGAVPTTFHGIDFEDWLEVFCRLSFLHSEAARSPECWSVLSIARNANVFLTNDDGMHKLHVCWLACGIQLNDEQHICQAIRLLMKQMPFSSDTYRLFGLCNRQYTGVYNFYNGGPWQKFLLRQIKMMDFAMLSPEERRQWHFTTQDQLSFSVGSEDGNPFKFTTHDPTVFIQYAHSLMMNASYYTALNYYFRAYAMMPNDPMINFCIGLCFMQNALKSKVENRQYQLQQGLAFLFRYYDFRVKSDKAIERQEAEFNVGRAWHLLGLTHLAIPQYEKVLNMSEKVRKEQEAIAKARAEQPLEDDEYEDDEEDELGYEDFAVEAAYATKMILALNEEYDIARKVAEKWLVIE